MTNEDIESIGTSDFDATEVAVDEVLAKAVDYEQKLGVLVPIYESLGACLESDAIDEIAEQVRSRLRVATRLVELLEEFKELMVPAEEERDSQIEAWARAAEWEPKGSLEIILALPSVSALVAAAKQVELLDRQIAKWDDIDWLLPADIDISSTGVYQRMAANDPSDIDLTDTTEYVLLPFLGDLASSTEVHFDIAECEVEEEDEDDDEEEEVELGDEDDEDDDDSDPGNDDED